MKIKEIMETDCLTISPDDVVKEVARILAENEIDGAPVVDGDDNLLGIVTGGDLLSRKSSEPSNFIHFLDNIFYMEDYDEFAEKFEDNLATKIENIMTEDVITVQPEDSVRKAADIFTQQRIKQIPVVEDDKVVGMLKVADLIAVIGKEK